MVITILFELLALIAIAAVAFAALDFKQTIDNDPTTPSVSELAKAWRRERIWHFAALAAGIFGLFLIPVLLAVHLLAELI